MHPFSPSSLPIWVGIDIGRTRQATDTLGIDIDDPQVDAERVGGLNPAIYNIAPIGRERGVIIAEGVESELGKAAAAIGIDRPNMVDK